MQGYVNAGVPVDVGVAGGDVAGNRRILSGDTNPGYKGCSAVAHLH